MYREGIFSIPDKIRELVTIYHVVREFSGMLLKRRLEG